MKEKNETKHVFAKEKDTQEKNTGKKLMFNQICHSTFCQHFLTLVVEKKAGFCIECLLERERAQQNLIMSPVSHESPYFASQDDELLHEIRGIASKEV